MKKEFYANTGWESLDQYFDFATTHRVWGADAIKEWKRLAKLTAVPEPKIRAKK